MHWCGLNFNVSDPGSSYCYNTNKEYKHSPLFGTDIVDYKIRIFPLHAAIICVVSATIQRLLKPLGVASPFVGHIATGLAMGFSGLMKIKTYENVVNPLHNANIMAILGNFGGMIYIFLIGLKMDISTMKRSSKCERAIGILSFILPLLFTVPSSFYLQRIALQIINKDELDRIDIKLMKLPWIATMVSTTSFHVIACFLADLNILNTELGRMATSASMTSGMLSLITIIILTSLRCNQMHFKTSIYYWCCALVQFIFIATVLRKIVIWMIKQTPRGERVKDTYLLVMYLMIIGTALIGEIFGQHFFFGPMILGLVIPNGPPIGSALVAKLDTLTSYFFLPIYFYGICQVVKLNDEDFFAFYWWLLLPLFILGFLGKLLGALIFCHIYQIPLKDAFMLGMTLSALGLLDVANYKLVLVQLPDDNKSFGVLIVFAASLTTITSMVVHFFFEPSRRYIVYKKMTIQNVKPNTDLRILVCTYNDENVPTIVNILEASNPTEVNPIMIYLLHLVELTGRSTPLVISHKLNDCHFNNHTPSIHIINSFKIFEKKYQGAIFLHAFTSFTPLLSAQEDICTLALDKRTSFIIIPLHELWNMDHTTRTYKWRNVNIKVLKNAPCSVGILIDRGVLNGARSILSSWSTYNVAILFLGDADDREAICFAMRMAKNPNVYLTVYRCILLFNVANNLSEKILDENVINEYRLNNWDCEKNLYKEEKVKDGVGIVSLIQTMDNSYDLILVGRRHDSFSGLFCGFTEWIEYPELGFFGDLLASADFKGNASVLIMQQHSCN